MVADHREAAIVTDLDGETDIGVHAQPVQPCGELFARVAVLVQHRLNVLEFAVIDGDPHAAFRVQAQAHGRGVHILFFQFFLDGVGQRGVFLQPLVDGSGVRMVAPDREISRVIETQFKGTRERDAQAVESGAKILRQVRGAVQRRLDAVARAVDDAHPAGSAQAELHGRCVIHPRLPKGGPHFVAERRIGVQPCLGGFPVLRVRADGRELAVLVQRKRELGEVADARLGKPVFDRLAELALELLAVPRDLAEGDAAVARDPHGVHGVFRQLHHA